MPVLVLAAFATPVLAQTESPIINRARFDSQGRLSVSVSEPGLAGCFLTVLGGLTAKKVNVPIVGVTVDNAEAAKGTASIRTKRRYFCRRRTLYVQVEKVCLALPLQVQSEVTAVSVPAANVR